MLNSLLNKGITEVLENDMIMYLKSFNNNEDLYFSFDGIFNYGRQL
jgi:hypothetical protein